MSTVYPIHVGSDPGCDPPEHLLEVTVTISHRRDVPPGEMVDAAMKIAERINRALHPSAFADLPIGEVHTDVEWLLRRAGPLFPLLMGDTLFTCRLDVAAALERLCVGTDLANYAYDFTGDAYAVSVNVSFTRVPEMDGMAPGAQPGCGA